MAIEDFFVLFRFIQEEEYFVQKIVTYSAGTIKNEINKAEGFSEDRSLKALLIPSADFVRDVMARAANTAEEFQKERYEFLEQHKVACANTIQSLQKVIKFFKKYETFYNQHKHGLTVALRPFAFEAPQAYLQQRKTSLSGDLVVFDNDTIEVAFNKGNLTGGALVMPAVTEATRPYLNNLQRERNLLRYFPRSAELHIDDFIEVVRSVAVLSLCLIGNRLDFIDRNREGCYTFSVVHSVKDKPLARLTASVEYGLQPITLSHFKIDV